MLAKHGWRLGTYRNCVHLEERRKQRLLSSPQPYSCVARAPPVSASCKAKTRPAATQRSAFLVIVWAPRCHAVLTVSGWVFAPGRRRWWWFGSARQSATHLDWLRPRRGWGWRSWGRTLGLWRQAPTPNFWPLRPPAPRDFFGIVGRRTIPHPSFPKVLSHQRPGRSRRSRALFAIQCTPKMSKFACATKSRKHAQ